MIVRVSVLKAGNSKDIYRSVEKIILNKIIPTFNEIRKMRRGITEEENVLIFIK